MNSNIEKSIAHIRNLTDLTPGLAIILGSGLGSFADQLDDSVKIPTSEIPFFPTSTVSGHQGCLIFGKWHGNNILALQGICILLLTEG